MTSYLASEKVYPLSALLPSISERSPSCQNSVHGIPKFTGMAIRHIEQRIKWGVPPFFLRFAEQRKKALAHTENRMNKASLMGSGDRNRTCDTGLMSPLLYRLSYAAS
jgi:hypothetical protein